PAGHGWKKGESTLKTIMLLVGVLFSSLSQAQGDFGDGGGPKPRAREFSMRDLFAHKDRAAYATLVFNLAKVSLPVNASKPDASEETLNSLLRLNMLRSRYASDPQSLPNHMDGEQFLIIRSKSSPADFARIELKGVLRYYF